MSVDTLVGIDVGSKELVASVKQGKKRSQLSFSNDADGHRKLCKLLTKRGRRARVCHRQRNASRSGCRTG